MEKELRNYIEQLNAEQKKSLLGFMKSLFPINSKASISIEEYNKELEDADASIEKGNYRTNEQVMEAAKKMIHAHK